MQKLRAEIIAGSLAQSYEWKFQQKLFLQKESHSTPPLKKYITGVWGGLLRGAIVAEVGVGSPHG